MPSRIEEAYARKILARKLRGGPADPRLVAQTPASVAPQVEIGPVEVVPPVIGQVEEIPPTLDPSVFGPITVEPTSKGELLAADAKSQALTKSQRRRLRRRKLEEALRAKAQAATQSPALDELMR